MGIHIKMRWYDIFMSRELITLKQSKPQPLKLFDERYSSQQTMWSFITWYPDKWKKHVVIFTKVLSRQNLFFKFNIYMTNAASWNELKLLSCRVFLFTKDDGSEENETVFKYYLSICFILFCFDLTKKEKEVVFQTCHCI